LFLEGTIAVHVVIVECSQDVMAVLSCVFVVCCVLGLTTVPVQGAHVGDESRHADAAVECPTPDRGGDKPASNSLPPVKSQLQEMESFGKGIQTLAEKKDLSENDDPDEFDDEDSAEKEEAALNAVAETEMTVELEKTIKDDGLPTIGPNSAPSLLAAEKDATKAKQNSKKVVALEKKKVKALRQMTKQKEKTDAAKKVADEAEQNVLVAIQRLKKEKRTAELQEEASKKIQSRAKVTYTLAKQDYARAAEMGKLWVDTKVKENHAVNEKEKPGKVSPEKVKAVKEVRDAMEELEQVTESEQAYVDQLDEADSDEQTTSMPPCPEYQKTYMDQLKLASIRDEKVKTYKDQTGQIKADFKEEVKNFGKSSSEVIQDHSDVLDPAVLEGEEDSRSPIEVMETDPEENADAHAEKFDILQCTPLNDS
jgi:hypothetical protein